ncbi:MAG: phosphopantothenoylcysteine decarboxylase, partial [Firmicutes bacterium]|nr:phosphopantothenoylcysteine decarboxylase [Bacillota bacterium]
PADYSDQKIKKKDGDLALPLARTVDILKTCGERKQKGQKLIGFAMETQDLLKNARVKLEKKNADFIVANTLTEAGAGFGVDTNHVTILSPDGEHDLGQLSKEETARKILEFCLR